MLQQKIVNPDGPFIFFVKSQFDKLNLGRNYFELIPQSVPAP